MINTVESVSHNLTKPTSFLMYSHDGFGLGHLKRNFTIAKAVIQNIPESQALLVMGHTSIPFHPIPAGIDFVKLPGIVKTSDESWHPRSLSISSEKLKELRASMIRTVAEHIDPDVFIVDYVPKGVWGELTETLEYLKGKSKKTKIILGLRDIIDDPELTCQRWEKGNTYQAIRDYYDQIFIYGKEEIFDTAYHYGLTGDLFEKVTYCGYLFSEEIPKSRECVRHSLRLQHENLIVITAGGGADAFPMMQQSLRALALLKEEISAEAIMITGPFMHPDFIRLLETEAEGLPVKMMTTADGIIDLMNAADLLVTMGSYNTLMEALRLKRPTLVIPREGPSAEQKMRAQIFSERGFLDAIEHPSAINPIQLAKRMRNALENIPYSFPLNWNGLKNVMSNLTNDRLNVVKEEIIGLRK